MGVLVRKPAKAKTLKDQVDMVTRRLFDIIQMSKHYIQNMLLDGGHVLDLRYDYKWKYLSGNYFSVLGYKSFQLRIDLLFVYSKTITFTHR